ncbi:Ctse [Symbiodinium sp. CCMP2592]|nr:Ctse [Symbiodinium sp. CCMP2592]
MRRHTANARLQEAAASALSSAASWPAMQAAATNNGATEEIVSAMRRFPTDPECRNPVHFGICRQAWIENGQKQGRGLKALFNRCLLLWWLDGALRVAAVGYGDATVAEPAARTRSLLSLHHLTSKRQMPSDITDLSSTAGTRLAVSESKLCALAGDTQLLVDSYGSADCNASAAPAAAKAVRMQPNIREGHITIDLERSEQEIHVLEDAIHYKSNLDIDWDGRLVQMGEARDQITVSFGTGEVMGVFLEDLLCLGHGHSHLGGSGVGTGPVGDSGEGQGNCLRMRFIAATDMSPDPFADFVFDGVLGLGLESLSQSPAFNFLHVASALTAERGSGFSKTFGIFLASHDGETSQITLGGWAEEHVSGEVTWSPVLQPELGRWLLEIKGLWVDGQEMPFCKEGCKAVVDSGTSVLSVPSPLFSDLYQKLSAPARDGSCSEGPQLQMELDGSNLNLSVGDFSRLDKESPSAQDAQATCRPMLMVMDLPEPLGPKLFVLGEPILKMFYTIYDAEAFSGDLMRHCTWQVLTLDGHEASEQSRALSFDQGLAANHPLNQSALLGCRSIEVIVSAMDAFVHHARLQTMACGALGNLAANSPNNQDHGATSDPSIYLSADFAPEKLGGPQVSNEDQPVQKMSSRQRRHMRWKNAEVNSNFMSKSQIGKIMSEASWSERMVRSKCFEWFSGSLILLNCIFIGWHTQMMASRAIENTIQNMDPHVKLGSERAHDCVSTSGRPNLC